MQKIPYFEVGAFSHRNFSGNLAGVVILKDWLSASLMQSIAAENNLSETAFIVGANGKYHLRWFTPMKEVDLCGHATLATTHIVMTELEPRCDQVTFSTEVSGNLVVDKVEGGYCLDFPSRPGERLDIQTVPEFILNALSPVKPDEAYLARDLMLVYNKEDTIRSIVPDFTALRKYDRWVCVTSAGKEHDFISRFFCAGDGIDEDPVTGSAHCTLVPYWSQKLGKKLLRAYQASARGGEIVCEDQGERIKLTGQAVTYLSGYIHI
jgi:predicted PhzF superfamily epimerase YddE/YHI9